MLNAFPQSQSTNPDVLLRTFSAVLGDVTPEAITEAAQRFVSGKVEGQSKTFAPAVAEFVAEARNRQEYHKLLMQPRLPAPTYYSNGQAPFERNRQKAFAANSHLPVLFEDVSYDRWKKLSAERQVPVGAKWVACLAIVYGVA